MLEIDHTLLIQIANFLLLLFLLNVIVYRPIRQIIDKRNKEISSSENAALNWRQEADKRSQEYEKNLSETRKQGLVQRESIKNQGIEEEKEMLQDIYASVEDKIGQARKEIQERISKARESLQLELEAFSEELAEKILGRGL